MTWFILYAAISGFICYMVTLIQNQSHTWSTPYIILAFFLNMLLGWITLPFSIFWGLIQGIKGSR